MNKTVFKTEQGELKSIDVALEHAILRTLNRVTDPVRLADFFDIKMKKESKTALARKIMEKRETVLGFTSIKEISDVPGMDEKTFKWIVNSFKNRSIANLNDLFRHRIGISKKINKSQLLCKLMLLNPARVLEEELGYLLLGDMAEKTRENWAPWYRKSLDDYFDHIKATGKGLPFLKDLKFIPVAPGAERIIADPPDMASARYLRSDEEKKLDNFDMAVAIEEEILDQLIKIAYWEEIFPKKVTINPTKILPELIYNALGLPANSNWHVYLDSPEDVSIQEGGIGMELFLSIETNLDEASNTDALDAIGINVNSDLEKGKYIVGSMVVVVSVQITSSGDERFVKIVVEEIKDVDFGSEILENLMTTTSTANSLFDSVFGENGIPISALIQHLESMAEQIPSQLLEVLNTIDMGALGANNANLAGVDLGTLDIKFDKIETAPLGKTFALASTVDFSHQFEGAETVYSRPSVEGPHVEELKEFIPNFPLLDKHPNVAVGVDGLFFFQLLKAYWARIGAVLDKWLAGTMWDFVRLKELRDFRVGNQRIYIKCAIHAAFYNMVSEGSVELNIFPKIDENGKISYHLIPPDPDFGDFANCIGHCKMEEAIDFIQNLEVHLNKVLPPLDTDFEIPGENHTYWMEVVARALNIYNNGDVILGLQVTPPAVVEGIRTCEIKPSGPWVWTDKDVCWTDKVVDEFLWIYDVHESPLNFPRAPHDSNYGHIASRRLKGQIHPHIANMMRDELASGYSEMGESRTWWFRIFKAQTTNLIPPFNIHWLLNDHRYTKGVYTNYNHEKGVIMIVNVGDKIILGLSPDPDYVPVPDSIHASVGLNSRDTMRVSIKLRVEDVFERETIAELEVGRSNFVWDQTPRRGHPKLIIADRDLWIDPYPDIPLREEAMESSNKGLDPELDNFPDIFGTGAASWGLVTDERFGLLAQFLRENGFKDWMKKKEK